MMLSWSTMRAWCAGALVTGAPVAAGFAALAPDAGSATTLVCLCVIAWASGPLMLLLRVEPSAERCAFAAGAGAGVLCGAIAAFPTPTAWFMSDVAWHVAKVARVALGHPLDDPILNVPTIYPFTFHAALAVPVALGAPVVLVMKICSVLVVAFLLGSFHALASAVAGVRRAAWAALALPLFFYASTAGYAFLPTAFNASLGFVFLGLLGLVAGTRSGSRRACALGGSALGVAGLCWYGHVPWIALAVLGWGFTRRRLLAAAIVGAAPTMLVLLVHVAYVRAIGNGDSAAIVAGETAASLAERLGGMGRNLLTLSGGFALDGAAVWVGPALLVLLLAGGLRGRDSDRSAEAPLRWSIASSAVLLVAAGLFMTFWSPFSSRYGFVLYATVLVCVASGREWTVARRPVGLLVLAACAAPLSAGNAVLLHLQRSRSFADQYARGGSDVARYLAEHTSVAEPVFASTDTWDRAIGCSLPRANLVARRAGIYNFAPADVVAPRWKDYVELLELSDPAAVRARLAPYGFHRAVVARAEAHVPGLGALARGFTPVLETELYVIVDLDQPR